MSFNYSGLGYTGMDPKEALAKAKAAALKALALDETLGSAHSSLALIKRHEWDWTGAETEHKRALELNPSGAGAHTSYAGFLSQMGRHNAALSEVRQAQELDPLRISAKALEGEILYMARMYDQAIQRSRTVLELEPDFGVAYEYLGYAYASKGMYAEAIAQYQNVLRVAKTGRTGIQCYLGYAYAKSGKRDEALAILDTLKKTKQYVSPFELGVLYVGLGDKEAALAELERAYAAHDLQMQFLKVEPSYDALRSLPRFQDLMRRVGLPL